MITTAPERTFATAEPTPESDAAAADLLARGDLRMRGSTAPQAAHVALSRVLASHPLNSEHGALLVAALRKRSKAERKRGPRPDAERAVRMLLELGQVPTPRAVAGQLRNAEIRREAAAARAVRIVPMVDHFAGDIARYVGDYRRRHGTGPGWGQVRRAFRRRWRDCDADDILRALVADGWLTATREPGSLAPGPNAKGLT